MPELQTRTVRVGDSGLCIGSGHPIVVQTMCNTHTSDVEATVAQCRRLAAAGAQLIRITVPSLSDVPHLTEIRRQLRSEGISVPLVADIHFSAEVAMAVVPVVEKIRINPGNFHPDHAKSRLLFGQFLERCKQYDRAIRIGINHGSLGKYIVERFGNTPEAMALAAMEWVDMCIDAGFYNVVVSLKASNTVVMVEAYRAIARMMQERGVVFPLHVGVTEAGNGDSGRIKSCVAIATLLSEGIGNTMLWDWVSSSIRGSGIPSGYRSRNRPKTRSPWQDIWRNDMGMSRLLPFRKPRNASLSWLATGGLRC